MVEESHYIEYPDGAKNTLTIYGSPQPKTIYLILPAMGIRASYYHRMKNLSTSTTSIATIDWRGHGHSSVRAGRKVDFGFKHWISDVEHTINFISEHFKEAKINLFGHSIGGQLAIIIAAKNHHIYKVISIGSSSPYYKTWKFPGYLKLRIATLIIKPITFIAGKYPGEVLGFAGNESRTTMADWVHVVKTSFYQPKGDTFDYEAALVTYDRSWVCINFMDDNLAPPYTLSTLTDKINDQSRLKKVVRDDFNHFNWAKSPEFLAEYL